MESTIFAGAVTVEDSGLFRRKSGHNFWEPLQAGLPDRVKVYAIVEGTGARCLLARTRVFIAVMMVVKTGQICMFQRMEGQFIRCSRTRMHLARFTQVLTP